MTDRGWALVTGARRRLGRALALAAAEAGHDILIHTRRPGDGEETAGLVRERGRTALTVHGDLSDPASPEVLIASAPSAPTLLVNCASLFEHDDIATMTAAGLDAAYAANLRAPLLLSKAFSAALPQGREGLIVNILDQRVWRPNPHFFSYTVTKAALWAATQTLAQALAPRIRVNGIGPGPTLANPLQTPESFAAEAAATPLGEPVHPSEIAAALLDLMDAKSVTGQMIAVDSGQHLAWRTPDVLDG